MVSYSGLLQLTAATATAKLLQSCSTLCDPIDGSPPGSAVPGILQARTLEWAAISFFICNSPLSFNIAINPCITISKYILK